MAQKEEKLIWDRFDLGIAAESLFGDFRTFDTMGRFNPWRTRPFLSPAEIPVDIAATAVIDKIISFSPQLSGITTYGLGINGHLYSIDTTTLNNAGTTELDSANAGSRSGSNAIGTAQICIFVNSSGNPFIYGVSNANKLWRYRIDTAAFTASYQTPTLSAYSSVVVLDNVLYVTGVTAISTLTAAEVWTATALQLTSDGLIRGFDKYGNGKVILYEHQGNAGSTIANDLSGTVTKKYSLYLWDGTSTTVTQEIPVDTLGHISQIKNINGILYIWGTVKGTSDFCLAYLQGDQIIPLEIYPTSKVDVPYKSDCVTQMFGYPCWIDTGGQCYVYGKVTKNSPMAIHKIWLDPSATTEGAILGLANNLIIGRGNSAGTYKIMKLGTGYDTGSCKFVSFNFYDLARLTNVTFSFSGSFVSGNSIVVTIIDDTGTSNSLGTMSSSVVSSDRQKVEFPTRLLLTSGQLQLDYSGNTGTPPAIIGIKIKYKMLD